MAVGPSVFPGTSWQEATPASQGVDETRLNEAMTCLQSVSGSNGVDQALVVRNGYIIWKGSDIDNTHNVWSCTKVFTSTTLGLMIEDGLCTLDTPASDHLPALAANYPGVTLRHFATMTSGYNAVGGDQSKTPFDPATPLLRPGAQFLYWDAAMNQFAHVLTRIANEPLESVFRRRIADPIQMNSRKWQWNDWGMVDGRVINGGAGNNSRGISISARELARLGLLFLNRGNWNGTQLLSTSWVHQATSPQIPASLPLYRPPRNDAGPGRYGFNWWCNGIGADGRRLWPDAPPQTYRASGFNNNTCTVIPEWNMVVVRLGTDGSIANENWNAFFARLSLAVTNAAPLPNQVIRDPVNPRGLAYNRDQDGNGKKDPFVMVAPGGPEGFLYLSAPEQNAILAAMQQHGGNALYLTAIRSHGGDGAPTENPFIDNDPAKGVDPAVLDRWDVLFTRMRDAGIVVYLIFYDDGSNPFGVPNPRTHPGVPLREKQFFQAIVHRFRSFPNLIWVISEEYDERMSASRAGSLAAVIAEADPHDHVIAIHQLETNPTFDFAGNSNLHQFAFQSPLTNIAALRESLAAAVKEADNRWHVNLAEDAAHAVALGAGNRTEVRLRNWAALMSGAHAMVYGTWESNGGTPSAAILSDMRRAQEFLESVDYNELAPADDLKHGGTMWVLAGPGNSYLLYSSSNAANLGVCSLPAGTYNLRWFDPVNGRVTTETGVSVPGGDTAFPKVSGMGAEAVLYIRASRQQPPESSPTLPFRKHSL